MKIKTSSTRSVASSQLFKLFFLFLTALSAMLFAAPTLTVVQTIGTAAHSIKIHGNYLYKSLDNAIEYYQRDTVVGTLTLAGSLSTPRGRCVITFANDRMYAAYTDISGLTCYNINPSTGEPVASGLSASTLPCWQILTGPDEKDIYVKSNAQMSGSIKMCVMRYALDSTGKPAAKTTVTGSGLGACSWGVCSPRIMIMTRDGKFIYTISLSERIVGCLQRDAAGEITYLRATSLATHMNAASKTVSHEWGGLAVTPDGKWLYANLWAYSDVQYNAVLVYQRNAETGELTFKSITYGNTDNIANLKGATLEFLPDGSGGFAGGGGGEIIRFNVDTATGQLTDYISIPQLVAWFDGLAMDSDFSNGLIYGGGGRGLWVVKTDPMLDATAAEQNQPLHSQSGLPRLMLSRNPVTGVASVEASLTGYQGTGNMVLQDITGRILFQTQLVNGKTGLSLIGLARGTYVISAKTKEGKSYSTKMTVLK